MGMSSRVEGIKAPGERWAEMKRVWDTCMAARVDPPKAVWDYFDGKTPDPAGVIINLVRDDAVKVYTDDNSSGFVVELSRLPKDLTHLRFLNSWCPDGRDDPGRRTHRPH